MPIYVGTATSTFMTSTRLGLSRISNATRNSGVGTATGTLIFNTSGLTLECYTGPAGWKVVKSTISATGGTKTTPPSGTVHTFTSSGTFTVDTAPSAGITVNYLLVGGGGGGGNAGGGGAGGFRTGTLPITGPFPISYNVLVGSGGVPNGPWPNNTSNNRAGYGGPSTIYRGTAPTRAFTNDPTLRYHIDARNSSCYPGTGTVITNLVPASPAGQTAIFITAPGGAPSHSWTQNNGWYFPGNFNNPNFIQLPSSATNLTFPGAFTMEIRIVSNPVSIRAQNSRCCIIQSTESTYSQNRPVLAFKGDPIGAGGPQADFPNSPTVPFSVVTQIGNSGVVSSICAPSALVPYVPNTEYHFVVSRSPTNIVTTYRNNIAISTGGAANTTVVTFSPDHRLGGLKANAEQFSDYFGGYIKLFRVYGKELSAAERLTNYNETETVNPAYINLTAFGGGAGGNYSSAFGNGAPGGSGGGAGGAGNPVVLNSIPGGTGNTPPATPSQGNPGGAGGSTTINLRSAGGGGAGGAGGNGGGGPGAGGNGTASSINGASVTYAGGGGGAGNPAQSPNTAGPGGTGGGGAGVVFPGNGQPATANLGGGGGGGPSQGGAGGSGIVIISY
jgi:hypothetical protein